MLKRVDLGASYNRVGTGLEGQEPWGPLMGAWTKAGSGERGREASRSERVVNASGEGWAPCGRQ